MPNNVFSNTRELACKAGSGKSIACFPDVCMTPPENPTTPPGVPVPYPNTGMATDTSKGSKKVKISKKEIMLKNKSHFKKSTGDEAGSAAKKGVVTSTNRGKVYFNAWSMDVKFEGKNVVRHLDMTTHNHMSPPGNTPPWPFIDSMAMGSGGGGSNDPPCKKEKEEEKEQCKDYKPQGEKDVCAEAGLSGPVVQKNADAQALGFNKASDWAKDTSKKAAANKCVSARRCQLTPYNAKKDGIGGCCPSQTADHIVPKSSFFVNSFDEGKKLDGWEDYDYSKAPCMCAEGGSNTAGSHGLRHAHHKANGPGKGNMTSFADEVSLCAKGAVEVFKSSGCSEECIKNQLEAGHKDMGDTSKDIKHSPSGSTLTNQEISSRASQLQPTTTLP
jgi:hypothetical protein